MDDPEDILVPRRTRANLPTWIFILESYTCLWWQGLVVGCFLFSPLWEFDLHGKNKFNPIVLTSYQHQLTFQISSFINQGKFHKFNFPPFLINMHLASTILMEIVHIPRQKPLPFANFKLLLKLYPASYRCSLVELIDFMWQPIAVNLFSSGQSTKTSSSSSTTTC